MSDHLIDIVEIAKRAGQVILDYYAKDQYAVWSKPDRTLITDANLSAQEVILRGLASKYDYPIISEEAERGAIPAGSRCWVVDSLDGTKDFIKRTDDFSVLIGLLEAGQPVLGAVYVPARDIIYCAEKGAGAWSQLHNRMPKPMHVSATAAIDRMTLVISRSNVSTLDIKIANELQCEYILRVGSVGHKLALVADGEADLYISTRPEVPVWDTCAAHIIIREAGGMITDLSGEPLRYDPEGLSHRHGVVATNGLNHSEIIARVAHTAAGQAV